MVRTHTNSMGDRDCYYGESTWEEIEVTCDECEGELDKDDFLYEYEKGKWCCLNCLKEKFNTKSVEEMKGIYYESKNV